METHGATCNTYHVKLYGKLHFLKRLKPAFASDIRYQEAFRKEFETGYRLEHPNLVRYISSSEDGILMEYVDGQTLTQCLTEHPDYFQSRQHTDEFISQLFDALQLTVCGGMAKGTQSNRQSSIVLLNPLNLNVNARTVFTRTVRPRFSSAHPARAVWNII